MFEHHQRQREAFVFFFVFHSTVLSAIVLLHFLFMQVIKGKSRVLLYTCTCVFFFSSNKYFLYACFIGQWQWNLLFSCSSYVFRSTVAMKRCRYPRNNFQDKSINDKMCAWNKDWQKILKQTIFVLLIIIVEYSVSFSKLWRILNSCVSFSWLASFYQCIQVLYTRACAVFYFWMYYTNETSQLTETQLLWD